MAPRKKPKPEEDPLSSHLYQRSICANCRKPITKERLEEAKKVKWLPLCEKCDVLIKGQLEKCRPLLKQLFGSKIR